MSLSKSIAILYALLCIVGCSPARVEHNATTINSTSEASLTPNREILNQREMAELRAATDRGHIVVNGHRASLNEAMALVETVHADEAEMAPRGAVARRVYGTREVPVVSRGADTVLTMGGGLPEAQREVFSRSLAARLTPTEDMIARGRRELQNLRTQELPSNLATNVSTRIAAADLSILYNDGTVTNPARPIHGTRGDYVLRFSFTPSAVPGFPTAPRVAVNLQLGGGYVGEIPAPSGESWRTPLTAQLWNVERTGLLSVHGKMVILDAQTQPVEFGTTGVWRDAKLFLYQYSYSPTAGFVATHYRTVTLPKAVPTAVTPMNPFPWVPGSGAVFPGSIALLDVAATENQWISHDPDVVITDNFNGIYTTSGNLSTVSLSILDTRMAGGIRAGIIQGVGPDGNYDVITPPPPGSDPSLAGVIGIYPGAHSVTSVVVRNGAGSIVRNQICWSVTYANLPNGVSDTQGMGLHCIDRAELTNSAIPPFFKTHDPAFGGVGMSHALVVPGISGRGDLVDALDNDRWNAPNMLYWMRAPADASNEGCPFYSALRRINLTNNVVELVKCDRTMFGWTNETSSSPTFIGFPVSKQIPSVGQEYNNPNLNMLVALGIRPEIYFQSRMPTVVAPLVTIF